MLNGEPTINVPWPWVAGGIVGIIGALAAAIRYLFKTVIDRHNAEIESRDKRRTEDSTAWKDAVTTIAGSNERAMVQLGATIGQSIKESTHQQTKVIEALSRQLRSRTGKDE